MREDYCDITVVLDRSGSMTSVRESTVQGLNDFIKGQKGQAGTAKFTLVQFDNEYEVVYDNMDINEVPEFDQARFVPRGMTALLDAIGRAINDTGKRFNNMAEQDLPSKVVFVILTDGHENASSKFSMEAIAQMITLQTDIYNWEIVFLGANQDAIATASKLSIPLGNVTNYNSTDIGTQTALSVTTRSVSELRAGNKLKGQLFSADEKATIENAM